MKSVQSLDGYEQSTVCQTEVANIADSIVCGTVTATHWAPSYSFLGIPRTSSEFLGFTWIYLDF